MSKGAARAHFCRHPDGFHQLLLRSTTAERRPRMASDAIGALGHMSDGDGDDLLDLCWEGAVSNAALLKA